MAMDPDFIEQLTQRLAAEVDAEDVKRKRRQRKAKDEARKREMKRRLGDKWQIQDVDVSEIQ